MLITAFCDLKLIASSKFLPGLRAWESAGMYCRECGARMDLASTVKTPDFNERTVQVFECEACDVIEVDHPAPMPPIEVVVEDALIDGRSRKSRLVYAVVAPPSKSKTFVAI